MSELPNFLPKMEEGKSYPVIPDRKPLLWWWLVSRKVQTWDWDETGLTEVIRVERYSWKRAFNFHIWYRSKPRQWWCKLMWRQRPCGCTQSILTRKWKLTNMRCPDSKIGKMFAEYGIGDEINDWAAERHACDDDVDDRAERCMDDICRNTGQCMWGCP